MIIGQVFRSFVHAFSGIKIVFKEEQNFRIQIALAVLVVVMMFIFSLSVIEKSVLTLLIIIVLVLEMLNSVLERFIDVFKPRVHTYIRDIKDIAAGAVFLSSLGSLLVGLVIFYPHIKELLFNLLKYII